MHIPEALDRDSYHLQAPKLNPYPGPRSVVVMDNCAIHHDEEICHIIEDDCGIFELDNNFLLLISSVGAKLIYLPPYSPDFNPINQVFHTIKAWLHCHEVKAISPEVCPWLIHQAALSVTTEMVEG